MGRDRTRNAVSAVPVPIRTTAALATELTASAANTDRAFQANSQPAATGATRYPMLCTKYMSENATACWSSLVSSAAIAIIDGRQAP